METLIRSKDRSPILPIFAIHRVPQKWRTALGADFQAMTGVKCGPAPSGRGLVFFLKKVAGQWVVTRVSDWVS